MATTFGLGAKIYSPTGLSICQLTLSLSLCVCCVGEWCNAHIGPSIWGGGICICVPLTKIWGTHPIHPSCIYAHGILAAVRGRWYNLGHNLYQRPTERLKIRGKVFSLQSRPSWYKLWPKLYQLPPWTGDVDIMSQFIPTSPLDGWKTSPLILWWSICSKIYMV